jgi:hypothetical protein
MVDVVLAEEMIQRFQPFGFVGNDGSENGELLEDMRHEGTPVRPCLGPKQGEAHGSEVHVCVVSNESAQLSTYG